MNRERKLPFFPLIAVVALLLAGCSAEPSQNVFDDMLKCDFIGFSDAVGATHVGEKFVLDDGLSLACEEDGYHVEYRLFRAFDDLTPYKLSMVKHVYVPLRGDGVLVVSYSEVYSSKTGALVREDAIYGEYVAQDYGDSNNRELDKYRSLSYDEAKEKLEAVGASAFLDYPRESPSDYFVALFLRNEKSTFSLDDWGSFDDWR